MGLRQGQRVRGKRRGCSCWILPPHHDNWRLGVKLAGQVMHRRCPFPFRAMLVYSGLRPPRVPGQGTAALADRHSFRTAAKVGATTFTSLLGLRGQLNAWLMATFGLSTPPIWGSSCWPVSSTAIADGDGLIVEIWILDAEAEAFHQAETGAVEELSHQFMNAAHLLIRCRTSSRVRTVGRRLGRLAVERRMTGSRSLWRTAR